jgi:phosphate transport system substrate-binding protein
MKKLSIAIALMAISSSAYAREQIRVVGSSTVYPFTTTVAEAFARSGNKAPIVESTGTGGGIKLFCAGVGKTFPDMVNASRAIKPAEIELCKNNGVTDIIEFKVGIDGIVLAQSKKSPVLNLTLEQVFMALAANVPVGDKLVANPNKTWTDINPVLPKMKIEVLGPPPTSGTRDSFHELFLEHAANKIPFMKTLDKKAFETAWKSIRQDGAYVEAGENDNVIVQKLEVNPTSIGIFGFSFLEENPNLRGVSIDGVQPTFDNISSGKYPSARPLFIYVKKQHIGVIPNLDKLIKEYISAKALSHNGYLARKGLVPLPKDELNKQIEKAKTL